MKNLSPTRMRAIIDLDFVTLTRLTDGSREATNLLYSAVAAAKKSEREHRAMGARFTRGAARYRLGITHTARYFVLKFYAEHIAAGSPLKPAKDWAVIRSEAFMAAALAELCPSETNNAALEIDYSKDIANGLKDSGNL